MHLHQKPVNSLAGDTVLWRYMSFGKFLSALETKTLFFSSVLKLQDQFEGSYPEGNIELRSLYLHDVPPDQREQVLKDDLEFQRKIGRAILVNCWSQKPHESDAMWNSYAGPEGVAIRTDVQSLRTCFTTKKDMWVSEVQYIDYETDTFDDLNDFTRYLMKRLPFEYEAEVRAFCMNVPMKDGEVDQSPESYDRPGVPFAVDVDVLIKEVIVAPEAPPWFLDLVKDVSARYGLAAPVIRSALADEPNWG